MSILFTSFKTELCTNQFRILLPESSKTPRAELFMRAYAKLPAFKQCVDKRLRSAGKEDGKNGEVVGQVVKELYSKKSSFIHLHLDFSTKAIVLEELALGPSESAIMQCMMSHCNLKFK
jgi:hypothetical protein